MDPAVPFFLVRIASIPSAATVASTTGPADKITLSTALVIGSFEKAWAFRSSANINVSTKAAAITAMAITQAKKYALPR